MTKIVLSPNSKVEFNGDVCNCVTEVSFTETKTTIGIKAPVTPYNNLSTGVGGLKVKLVLEIELEGLDATYQRFAPGVVGTLSVQPVDWPNIFQTYTFNRAIVTSCSLPLAPTTLSLLTVSFVADSVVFTNSYKGNKK